MEGCARAERLERTHRRRPQVSRLIRDGLLKTAGADGGTQNQDVPGEGSHRVSTRVLKGGFGRRAPEPGVMLLYWRPKWHSNWKRRKSWWQKSTRSRRKPCPWWVLRTVA